MNAVRPCPWNGLRLIQTQIDGFNQAMRNCQDPEANNWTVW